MDGDEGRGAEDEREPAGHPHRPVRRQGVAGAVEGAEGEGCDHGGAEREPGEPGLGGAAQRRHRAGERRRGDGDHLDVDARAPHPRGDRLEGGEQGDGVGEGEPDLVAEGGAVEEAPGQGGDAGGAERGER